MPGTKTGNQHIRASEDGSLEGFQDLADMKLAKLTVGLWGATKMFKTALAYDFPEPVYHINFDREAATLLPHFPGKDIKRQGFVANEDAGIKHAKKKMEQERASGYRRSLSEDPEGYTLSDVQKGRVPD